MKKIIMITMLGLVSAALFVCKGGSDGELEYASVSAYDWVQANVHDKASKKGVMWFQLFDHAGDQGAAKAYRDSAEKVDKSPASVFADKFVWVLVNNRFEIRLMADEKTPDYQNTEKLKDFVRRFDLSGMEQYTGPKLGGEEMRKFMPKLK